MTEVALKMGLLQKKKKSKMQYGIPKKDPVGVKPNKLL
jgi:hypothetical protein